MNQATRYERNPYRKTLFFTQYHFKEFIHHLSAPNFVLNFAICGKCYWVIGATRIFRVAPFYLFAVLIPEARLDLYQISKM